MMVVDSKTGKRASYGSKETIVESFKKHKIENKSLDIDRVFENSIKNNILKFY